MSGPESNKPDDRALEDFLTGQSKVARAYRDALPVTAPSRLDAPVLKIARDELGRPQIVRAELARRRWRLPLAAAAVLALSFNVLLNVQEDREARSMVFELAPAAPAPAPPPPMAAMEAPEPTALKDKLDIAAQDIPSASELSQPRAMEYRQAQEQVATSAEADRSAPAAASPPPAQVQSAPLEARSKAESAAPSLAKRERKALMMAPPAAGAAAAKPKPAAPAAARQDTGNAVSQEEKKQILEKPLPWLARIRALRNEGRLAAARKELAAFQEAYPDQVLPGDLQPLNSASDAP